MRRSSVTRLHGGDITQRAPQGARIKSDRAAWNRLAHGLQDAALVNQQAIEARDLTKFLEAGETLDKACENCHREYWYRVPPPVDALNP